jgi:ferric-dicitrate binding protein FerR (iron transport regulator)
VNTRQESSEVFLKEGEVRLSLKNSDTPEIRLQPGEVVTYSSRKKLLVKPQQVDQVLEIHWKDGFLTFKDTPLIKILEELFATNNFEFEIKDKSLEPREFSVTLPNKDIEEALKLLNRNVKAEIIKNGNKFVFLEK